MRKDAGWVLTPYQFSAWDLACNRALDLEGLFQVLPELKAVRPDVLDRLQSESEFGKWRGGL